MHDPLEDGSVTPVKLTSSVEWQGEERERRDELSVTGLLASEELRETLERVSVPDVAEMNAGKEFVELADDRRKLMEVIVSILPPTMKMLVPSVSATKCFESCPVLCGVIVTSPTVNVVDSFSPS